jgi:heme A synthase
MGVGAAAGLAAGALALVVVALPLFFFARAADPARGTGRPFIHTGLVVVAVPLALAVGLAVGGLAAVWYRRGGRLPQEDDGYWRR